MIRIKGRYSNQAIQLDQPLDLPENAEIELDVHLPEDTLKEEWSELGMSRLEEEWDNPGDAIYDDWKKLYGV